MNKIFKSVVLSLLLIVSCAMLFSCRNKEINMDKLGDKGYIFDGQKEIKPESIIKINGISVPFQEYRYFYLNTKDQMSNSEAKYWVENPAYINVLKDNVYDTLVELYSIRALCAEAGVKSDLKEVWDTVDEFRDTMNKDEFKNGLELHYLTEDLYAYLLEGWQLYDKLYEYYFGESGKSVMSDEKLIEYVNNNYYHIEHIYIKTKTQYKEDEIEEVLNVALEKAVTTGDFASLVKEYGVDDSIPEYIFRTDEDHESFVSVCEELEIGEVSGLVNTPDGTYIIKRIPVDTNDTNELREMVYNQMYADLIENKIKSATVETTPEYEFVAPDTLK